MNEEELWLERMRIEVEKAQECNNCEQLTNRLDLLAKQVPE